MKSIDFSTSHVSQCKPLNEERVDEFLGAILIAGFCGMLASKAMLSWWGGIQELRTGIAKSKAERAKSKTEKMQERTKQLEEQKNRYLMLFGNANEAAGPGAKDPDGNDMGKLANVFQRIAKGEATDEDIEYVGKIGKRKPTNEENKIAKRVEDAAGKYTQKDIDKYCEEHGIPKNADPEVVGKMMDAHKAAMQKVLPEPIENKTNDELRQEIKDKLKDAKEEEIPPSLKDKDGKLDIEKLDKATGDELAGFAKDCGVETVKPKQTQGAQGTEQTQGTQGAQGGTQGAQEPQKPDEEWVDDDGTKYTKIGDKYTMTTKDGDTTELTQDEYENHIENDDVKDADRTDNDDDLEDNTDPTDMSKDPRKKYKQRTYKRGSKTFRTKSYYDKKGNSLSKEDFKKMVQAYEERQKGKKRKNESWCITKLSSMKSKPVVEAKATDRIDITKERLVYIRYVMDTTTKSVEKVAMERMYNALFDLAFNADGTPRSLEELYSYLDQTMIENKGKIPGLPNETQIENIDEKVQAFKKLHTHEYDAYLKRLDKELLDKAGDKKGDDAAADLLHPAKDETDAKTIDDIRKLSTIYGFTNILGLEPERKPNQKDIDNKDEIDKQHKDGSSKADSKDSKNVKADDISDEQIDKIIGVK